MSDHVFTVYITKCAITIGILKEFAINCKTSSGMIEVVNSDGSKKGIFNYYHGENRDWHRTFEGAQKRAEEMKIKKLKSLESQIKRISILDFDNYKDQTK